MSGQGFGPGSRKSFRYPTRAVGGDFDLEAGISRKGRKPKNPHLETSVAMRFRHFYEAHPVAVAAALLFAGLAAQVLLYVHEARSRAARPSGAWAGGAGEEYPLPRLRNLVMVAGHSVYTIATCGGTDREESWFLEPYQRHPGQAATFVAHIKEGVDIAARDDGALLLFSGGETRKDAGPRSEAQSYWAIAESKGWFGEFFSLFLCPLLGHFSFRSFMCFDKISGTVYVWKCLVHESLLGLITSPLWYEITSHH